MFVFPIYYLQKTSDLGTSDKHVKNFMDPRDKSNQQMLTYTAECIYWLQQDKQ